MNGTTRPWPPLIIAERAPRGVKVRDIVLTLIMWVLFAIMLETEFELFAGDYLKQLIPFDFHTEPNWPVFFARLAPFLMTAAVLAGLLVLAAVQTLRRGHRSLLLPQPLSLEAATQAHRAGMDEASLIAARDLRIAIVYIDTDGKHRIDALETPPE
jgi:hypothetical protein